MVPKSPNESSIWERFDVVANGNQKHTAAVTYQIFVCMSHMCQYNCCNVAAQNGRTTSQAGHALVCAYNSHFAFFTIRNSANKINCSRPIPLLMLYAVRHVRARELFNSIVTSTLTTPEQDRPTHIASFANRAIILHFTWHYGRSKSITIFFYSIFCCRILREPRVKTHYNSQWCARLCRARIGRLGRRHANGHVFSRRHGENTQKQLDNHKPIRNNDPAPASNAVIFPYRPFKRR